VRGILILIIVIGVLGLVAGYLIFARTEGGYLTLKTLLRPSKGALDDLVRAVRGIQKIRRNILICGAVGAGIGLVLGVVNAGGSRRRRR
jgi:uncharacterized protein (TIGR03382 family)